MLRLAIVALVSLMALPAQADWRQEIGTFRIGIVAANAPTRDGVAALRRSFSAALGMPVDFFIAKDFAMLVDAQASSRVDYAVYSATSYATASMLCECVEPLAAAVDVDGGAGVRSILVVRSANGNQLSDVSGLRLAVPHDDSISGWQAPLPLLAKEGLDLKDSDSVLLAKSASEAEALFIAQKADALLGWERVTLDDQALPEGGTQDRLRRAGVDQATVQIVWRSPLVRYGPHAVRKSLNSDAKAILLAYLIGLHSQDPQAYDLLSGGHGGGFGAVDNAAYLPALAIVRETIAETP